MEYENIRVPHFGVDAVQVVIGADVLDDLALFQLAELPDEDQATLAQDIVNQLIDLVIRS